MSEDKSTRKRLVPSATPEYQRAKRLERRANGQCTWCKLPVVAARLFCQRHLDLARSRTLAAAKKKVANAKCSRCPAERVTGKTLCQKCCSLESEKTMSKSLFRRANGLCVKCASPVKKFIHCDDCKGRELARRRTLKAETFIQYGGVRCDCCGITEIDFLTIEHVDNDGAEHRKSLGNLGGYAFYKALKKQGYPKVPRMTVNCFNCNTARGLFGTCPHERMRCKSAGEDDGGCA